VKAGRRGATEARDLNNNKGERKRVGGEGKRVKGLKTTERK